MIKKYILVLLAAICCLGCREDETVDITVMPEISSCGANTFGCLVDGWLYVGGRYHYLNVIGWNTGPSIDFCYNQENETMDVNVIVKEDKTIRFTILSPREGEEAVFTDARFDGEELEDGTVHILRFDEKKRIISGTFRNNDGRITHGRFDIHYDTDEYSSYN